MLECLNHPDSGLLLVVGSINNILTVSIAKQLQMFDYFCCQIHNCSSAAVQTLKKSIKCINMKEVELSFMCIDQTSFFEHAYHTINLSP